MSAGDEAVWQARVGAELAQLRERYRIPGFGLALMGPDGLARSATAGFADLESRQPLVLEQRFRIGSITKTMIALCALQLCEEEKLSLDDSVQALLPDVELRGPTDGLCVRHLLTHTSGIGEAATLEDLAAPGFGFPQGLPAEASLAEIYPRGIALELPPGARFAYANIGFQLLGEICARRAGVPVPELLRRRIFEPLGMQHSDCNDGSPAELAAAYALPLHPDERALLERTGVPLRPDGPELARAHATFAPGPVATRAAGAVQSTLPDMARYAAALLRRGAGLVRAETFDSMVSPQFGLDPRLIQLGLAFQLEPRFGRRSFGHGGAVPGGHQSQLAVFPREGLAIVVWMNLWCGMVASPAEEIWSRAIAAALGVEPQAPPSLALAPDLLESAPGRYQAPEGALTTVRVRMNLGRLEIRRERDQLALYSRRGAYRNGVALRAADPADPCFLRLETASIAPPHLLLRRNASGAVSGLVMNRLAEFERAPG